MMQEYKRDVSCSELLKGFCCMCKTAEKKAVTYYKSYKKGYGSNKEMTQKILHLITAIENNCHRLRKIAEKSLHKEIPQLDSGETTGVDFHRNLSGISLKKNLFTFPEGIKAEKNTSVDFHRSLSRIPLKKNLFTFQGGTEDKRKKESPHRSSTQKVHGDGNILPEKNSWSENNNIEFDAKINKELKQKDVKSANIDLDLLITSERKESTDICFDATIKKEINQRLAHTDLDLLNTSESNEKSDKDFGATSEKELKQRDVGLAHSDLDLLNTSERNENTDKGRDSTFEKELKQRDVRLAHSDLGLLNTSRRKENTHEGFDAIINKETKQRDVGLAHSNLDLLNTSERKENTDKGFDATTDKELKQEDVGLGHSDLGLLNISERGSGGNEYTEDALMALIELISSSQSGSSRSIAKEEKTRNREMENTKQHELIDGISRHTKFENTEKQSIKKIGCESNAEKDECNQYLARIVSDYIENDRIVPNDIDQNFSKSLDGRKRKILVKRMETLNDRELNECNWKKDHLLTCKINLDGKKEAGDIKTLTCSRRLDSSSKRCFNIKSEDESNAKSGELISTSCSDGEGYESSESEELEDTEGEDDVIKADTNTKGNNQSDELIALSNLEGRRDSNVSEEPDDSEEGDYVTKRNVNVKDNKKSNKLIALSKSDNEGHESSDSEELNDSAKEEGNITKDYNNLADYGGQSEFQEVLECEEANQKNIGRKSSKCAKSVLTFKQLENAVKMTGIEEEETFRTKQSRITLSTELTEKQELILDTTKDGVKIKVDSELCKKLFPNQRDGVTFMWKACFESVEKLQESNGSGCILAHSMGLGKTFQVVTLLHTLFSYPVTNTKHVLIVCPVSTVGAWMKEIKTALKTAVRKIDIIVEHIDKEDSLPSKLIKIGRWCKLRGIILFGYEAFVRLIFTEQVDEKIKNQLRKALICPGPDLMICDEGHLLKNDKSKRSLALSKVTTTRRIVLSGTPMQNNLKEYYYMVKFVNPNILGKFKQYYKRFVFPITNGQYENSTRQEIMTMKEKTHVLHVLLRNIVQRYEVGELKKYLEPIKNYTVFIKLHPIQAAMYGHYIRMAKDYHLCSGNKANLFTDFNIVKYICCHPYLLSVMEKKLSGNKEESIPVNEFLDIDFIGKDWWKEFCPEKYLVDLDYGPKLKIALDIIDEAEKLGEKVLLFTTSLFELDSVEFFLKKVGTSRCKPWQPERDYFRMDGSVPYKRRTEMIASFNNPACKSLRLFLISCKAGGMGITLTSANRVIILGTMFNPSYDTQSVYRCYRFGQNKTVYVYRLIALGTMEEKIYWRCVNKLALASRVVDKHQIKGHYDSTEIKQLYVDEVNLDLPRPALNKPDDYLLATLILRYKFLHRYLDHEALLENRPEEDLSDVDKERAWTKFKIECENATNDSKLSSVHPFYGHKRTSSIQTYTLNHLTNVLPRVGLQRERTYMKRVHLPQLHQSASKKRRCV